MSGGTASPRMVLPGWSSAAFKDRSCLAWDALTWAKRKGGVEQGQQAGSLSAGRAWKCDHRTPRLDTHRKGSVWER